MPRISSSVWPGPLVLMDCRGTHWTTAEMSVMPRSASSCPDSAVMLMGVSCTVDSRFCAVTMISWSESDWSARAPTAKARETTDADMVLRPFMGFPCYREQRAALTECYSSLRLSAACWRNQRHKAGKTPDLALKHALARGAFAEAFLPHRLRGRGFPSKSALGNSTRDKYFTTLIHLAISAHPHRPQRLPPEDILRGLRRNAPSSARSAAGRSGLYSSG